MAFRLVLVGRKVLFKRIFGPEPRRTTPYVKQTFLSRFALGNDYHVVREAYAQKRPKIKLSQFVSRWLKNFKFATVQCGSQRLPNFASH